MLDLILIAALAVACFFAGWQWCGMRTEEAEFRREQQRDELVDQLRDALSAASSTSVARGQALAELLRRQP